MPCKNAILVLALAAVVLSLPGCGSKEPSRYDLSGSVTFNGKPVPAGSIVFAPDSAKGNTGPGSMVTIENGKYVTPSGRGPIGGPHTVTISGFEPAAGGGQGKSGKALFTDYRTTVDLPKKSGTQDFTVPPTAAAPAPSTPGKQPAPGPQRPR